MDTRQTVSNRDQFTGYGQYYNLISIIFILFYNLIYNSLNFIFFICVEFDYTYLWFNYLKFKKKNTY